MNNYPRRQLQELLTLYGPTLYNDPIHCKALLQERCSAYPTELEALTGALDTQIVTQLVHAAGTIPYKERQTQLIRRWQDKQTISDLFAAWAIDSWALALGIITVAPDEDATVNSSPFHPPQPGTQPHEATTGSAGYYNYPTTMDRKDPSQFPVNNPYENLPVSYIPVNTSHTNWRTMLIVGSIALLIILSGIGLFTYKNLLPALPYGASTPTTIVTYPQLATAYGGEARNTSTNQSGNMSLTAIAQNQGNISGDLTIGLPLQGSGLFKGSITPQGLIKFTVNTNDGTQLQITFTGTLNSSKEISGTYSINNSQGGTFNTSPTQDPVVYPVLFANYSGNFYNSMTSTSGAITIAFTSQDNQDIKGVFSVGGESEPLTGTVGSDNSIKFTLTGSTGAVFSFTGTVNVDTSISGNYSASSGGNGTWQAKPS